MVSILDNVLAALRALRIGVQTEEYDLQREIASVLSAVGIGYRREVRLGKRCRVDFLTENGVVLEIKKGRPRTAEVDEQLRRYAGFDRVQGVILVVEGHCAVPDEIDGKPVAALALRRLWGIAL